MGMEVWLLPLPLLRGRRRSNRYAETVIPENEAVFEANRSINLCV